MEIPLYRHIANRLKADMEVGHYEEGDKLPSESELGFRFGVSRITVRRALNMLEEQGCVYRRQGVGTFAKQRNILRVLQRENLDTGLFSYSDSCRACGLEPNAVGAECKVIKAPLTCQLFFGIGPACDVMRVERVRTADDVPILIEANYFRSCQFDSLKAINLEGLSIFDVLKERFELVPRLRETCSIEVVEASKEMAGKLEIGVGEPLFVLAGYYLSQHGEPLFYGEQFIVGSRYAFTV